MDNLLTPPSGFIGSSNKEINEMGSYLYRVVEQLNYTLNNLSFENFQSDIQKNLTAASENGAVSKQDFDESMGAQYEGLKSLIIKTSKNVNTEIERVLLQIKNEYIATSEFGDFKEKTEIDMKATSTYLDNIFSLYQNLDAALLKAQVAFENYQLDTNQYIRTGLLYYEDVEGNSIPRYGVAVGESLTTVKVDGKEVLKRENLYSTFTSDRLSFWQGTNEVAYVSSGRLYINEARINGSLTFSNKWKIDTINGFTLRKIGGLI